MRVAILPFGSRGDVQPYVALAVGFQRAGHEVVIPVSSIYRDLVTDAGLPYIENTSPSPQQVTEDPDVQAAVSKGQIQGLLAVLGRAGPYLDQIFDNCWIHSEGADVIITSMLPWGGTDSAEKRGIPVIRAPLHSLYPTRALPSPFISPGKIRFNHPFNPMSYRLLRFLASAFTHRAINRWRRERLGLAPLTRRGVFAHMDALRIPVIYGFSRHVLPTPTDWPEWHQIAGYWFLDEHEDWQPPDDLAAFVADGPPPVFVGFGSMGDQKPERTTQVVIEAIEKSGQQGIIQSGWMGLGDIDLPDNILRIDSVLHSWLFPRMAAVVHHGGMGTTAAGLRAGVPGIITPVLGDQYFWAKRLEQLGVGVSPSSYTKLTADGLAGAIRQVVTDTGLRERAARLGERIRAEDGVETAVRMVEAIVGQKGL